MKENSISLTATSEVKYWKVETDAGVMTFPVRLNMSTS